MQRYREIGTCIEYSAYKHIRVLEVLYYTQKAVLHSIGMLFDQETQTLKLRCVRSLKRYDRDGTLGNAELMDFQVKCFNALLQPSKIVGAEMVVQDMLIEGVNEGCPTLTDFLFLHALFIENGQLETTWNVMRRFKRTLIQSMELTNEAIKFLKGFYELFDSDLDANLCSIEVKDVCSTSLENPWNDAPFKDVAGKTAPEELSLAVFSSEWSFMTFLDPARSIENLIYIGFGDLPSLIRVARRMGLVESCV
ncbi:hypothetical protein V6N13_149638 [Hibiscus sabdariffa]